MPTDCTPPSSPRRLPAEWEGGGAVLIAWPHEETDWAPMLAEARACYRGLARALVDAGQLPVVVTPAPGDASADLDAAGIAPSERLVVEMATNDTWTRDYGPVTVLTDGGEGHLLLDYQFNGWGLKFAACHDNLVSSRLRRRGVLRAPMECRRRFVLEGGSIESDGEGTLMVTSRCLLSPNRNAGLTRRQVEAELRADLGVTNIIWLDYGDIPGDDTDGHIDTLARFAPGGVILFSAPVSTSHPLWPTQFAPMVEQLKGARDARGRSYSLMHLPMPVEPLLDPDDGHELPANYVNFLATPTAVLMPVYGRPLFDRMALTVAAQAFPGRRVLPVDCTALVRQHGSLHCATMQLPREIVCF